MSFWSKLFGGGGSGDAGGGESAPEESYKGFTIKATLMPNGSEFQLAGVIEKDVGGTRRSYNFVRADRFSSRDQAVSVTFGKGRQLIDEQGEALFSP